MIVKIRNISYLQEMEWFSYSYVENMRLSADMFADVDIDEIIRYMQMFWTMCIYEVFGWLETEDDE